MKQRNITSFILIAAVTGLSPVLAADAENASAGVPIHTNQITKPKTTAGRAEEQIGVKKKELLVLSETEMDRVAAGYIVGVIYKFIKTGIDLNNKPGRGETNTGQPRPCTRC